MSFLILWGLLLSLLLISFVIMSLLLLKLRQVKLLLLKHPAVYGSKRDSTSSGSGNAQANPGTRCD